MDRGDQQQLFEVVGEVAARGRETRCLRCRGRDPASTPLRAILVRLLILSDCNRTPAHEATFEGDDFEKLIRINVNGMMNTAQVVARIMPQHPAPLPCNPYKASSFSFASVLNGLLNGSAEAMHPVLYTIRPYRDVAIVGA